MFQPLFTACGRDPWRAARETVQGVWELLSRGSAPSPSSPTPGDPVQDALADWVTP
jgi:hypothetical protein